VIINVDSDPNCTSFLRQIIKHTFRDFIAQKPKNCFLCIASDNHDQQKETSYNNKYFPKKEETRKLIQLHTGIQILSSPKSVVSTDVRGSQ